MIKKITLAFLLNIFLLNNAYAYLDPVSSLVIFQAIVAFIASAYAVIILKPLNFIKKIFSSKKKKIEKNKKNIK